MSVDYDLVCHNHKHKVMICSDGFSGPLAQGNKSMAAFAITHRDCHIAIIDEHNEDCDSYKEWDLGNYKELMNYDIS